MARSNSFYEQVVRVTYTYLGPAADRFVARQITNHLGKKPEQLTGHDLPELIDWIRLAMGFLTQDKEMIEKYIGRLQALDESPQPRIKTHANKSR